MIRISSLGFLLLCLAGVALARRRVKVQNDCNGLADGSVVTWGCRSFTVCQGGAPVVVDCSSVGLVYNPEKKKCDNKLNTPPPCGLYRDCRGKADGRYADLATNCSAYYTCNGGKFFGHNKCNPGLIFNQEAQVCDWPYNVPPPCGTKGGVKTKPDKASKAVPKRGNRERKNRRRRVKIARTRQEKVMELKMRLVEEDKKGRNQPRRKPLVDRKRNKKNKIRLMETVYGM